jgi:hypothetical protein
MGARGAERAGPQARVELRQGRLVQVPVPSAAPPRRALPPQRHRPRPWRARGRRGEGGRRARGRGQPPDVERLENGLTPGEAAVARYNAAGHAQGSGDWRRDRNRIDRALMWHHAVLASLGTAGMLAAVGQHELIVRGADPRGGAVAACKTACSLSTLLAVLVMLRLYLLAELLRRVIEVPSAPPAAPAPRRAAHAGAAGAAHRSPAPPGPAGPVALPAAAPLVLGRACGAAPARAPRLHARGRLPQLRQLCALPRRVARRLLGLPPPVPLLARGAERGARAAPEAAHGRGVRVPPPLLSARLQGAPQRATRHDRHPWRLARRPPHRRLLVPRL